MPDSASDADYAAFLEKANQPTNSSGSGATASSTKKQPVSTTSVNTQDVPAALSSIDAFYTSESDERFQPVSLLVPEGVTEVDVEAVKAVTGRDDVEGVEVGMFDPRGEYKGVIQKVKSECEGSPRVFRVGLGGARCEYWIVGLAKDRGRILGVKALAVES